MAIQLQINGGSVAVPQRLAEQRLLPVLREVLNLTGSKFGCGVGLCGACTVHVDGQAMRSCLLRVRDVQGQAVTTIEGLAATAGDGHTLHPLQQAWLDERVPQCGYCQAGQLMTAAALLKHNPNPSTAEIRTAMSRNLCRCGTYDRIVRAIAAVAANGADQ